MDSTNRHVRRHYNAGRLLALAGILILSMPWVAGASPAGDSSPTIRAAGPASAKGMMEELVAEFSTKPGNTATSLDYARVDGNVGAAGALVSGRDMALTIGKITEKDLGFNRDGWKKLSPQEQILGGRALAVVVHPRNSVGTLSVDQLRSIFSAKEREWKVFGGDAKAIRRYALASADPLQMMFHEKVLPPVKCAAMQRKKDSAEAVAALAADPLAIGVVDAVAAMAAGDAVKIVSIGDGPEAVLPNARTIKDGSYNLAHVLALYVSPKAAAPAPAFTRFLLSGDGDAVFRKHGFMPTVRAIKPDLAAAFQKLYAAEIKRVKATAGDADDMSLASQMIDSARKIKLDEDMLTALCGSAYDLAFPAADGQVTAFEAIWVLRQKVPEQMMDCQIRAAAMYERAYRTDKSPAARADGEHLVETLMAAADAGTSIRQFAKAGETWRRALAVAEELSSPQITALKERLPAFTAREQTVRQAEELSSLLAANPRDPAMRRRMLNLQLVEMDDPGEAMKFLDAAAEESFKTNVPLARERVEKLSEDGSLTLGEWYAGLGDKAGVGGRELMNGRAVRYYLWFFELHKEREDTLGTRAALGIKKVGGTVPPAPTTRAAKPIPPPSIRNVTDLKLIEYVTLRTLVTTLGPQQIGSARLVTDIRSVGRLQKLTSLELRQAEGLQEIPQLNLDGLTSLTVTGLQTEKIGGLSGFPNLTALDLSGAKNIADLSPVSRLHKLQRLNLSGCERLADLTPLAQLAELTSLTLADCPAVSDLKPLEKLSGKLSSLDLRGCPKISDISVLSKLTRLKTLDLRDCKEISEEDAESLRRDLPNCKVLTSPPKKATATIP